jgi:hypothetical protein
MGKRNDTLGSGIDGPGVPDQIEWKGRRADVPRRRLRKTPERLDDDIKLRTEILEKRKAGISDADIALALKLPVLEVARQVQLAIRETRKHHELLVEEQRDLDLARADDILSGNYGAAKCGDIDAGKLALDVLKFRATTIGYQAPKPSTEATAIHIGADGSVSMAMLKAALAVVENE